MSSETTLRPSTGPAAPLSGRRGFRTGQSRWGMSLAAQGEPMIWLTGGALVVALAMIVGLLGFVLYQGLATFWPSPVERIVTDDGRVSLGEIARRELYPVRDVDLTALAPEVAERARSEADSQGGKIKRELVRIENFELTSTHFKWVDDFRIQSQTTPEWATVVERLTMGRFYGEPSAFVLDGRDVADSPAAAWQQYVEQHPSVRARWRQRERLAQELRQANRQKSQAQVTLRQRELQQGRESSEFVAAERDLAEAERVEAQETARIEAQIEQLRLENARYQLRLTTADGQPTLVALEDIVRAYPANQLGWFGKWQVYLSRWREFLLDEPRQANSEGGVFPAIFGTVAMTLIMSLAVVPFGVLAALYLREYAKAGPVVSAVRIAINNLSGVPSIVFGVFGLGFFCYVLGASIDQMFFAARLPTSTFGTGGLLWASLTLALLTVPVVIVTTEEALAAVPSSMREGSYACGASKWQTIYRIVLPRALPGIMTGMILAMARGAGEVAPLMLVGAMKVVPDLPVDGVFPYVHPERSFMHLGYQIYDLGFHSQNSEAAKPMVFTTTLLLVTIIGVLNLAAIWLRARLRRRFLTSHF